MIVFQYSLNEGLDGYRYKEKSQLYSQVHVYKECIFHVLAGVTRLDRQ